MDVLNAWITETERLRAKNEELLAELENIIRADYKTWGDGLDTPENFVLWAKSRATHAIAKAGG
jgi:hypothetical protein